MGANTYREMLEIATAQSDVPVFERMAQIPKLVCSQSISQEPTQWFTSVPHLHA